MNLPGFDGFDRIFITGVRATGYHGVLERERREGQEFVVDAVLHTDVRQAARTDDLAHTVDYSQAAAWIAEQIEGEPVRLIETLAQRIADVLLAAPRVSMVEVCVHKPDAPVPVRLADVAVRIVRAR